MVPFLKNFLLNPQAILLLKLRNLFQSNPIKSFKIFLSEHILNIRHTFKNRIMEQNVSSIFLHLLAFYLQKAIFSIKQRYLVNIFRFQEWVLVPL